VPEPPPPPPPLPPPQAANNRRPHRNAGAEYFEDRPPTLVLEKFTMTDTEAKDVPASIETHIERMLRFRSDFLRTIS